MLEDAQIPHEFDFVLLLSYALVRNNHVRI